MIKKWLVTTSVKPDESLKMIRITVALIIMTHPIHGLSNPGDIVSFGEYLSSIGFPFGVALAWSIMFIQIACSLLLVFDKLVVPACLGHVGILMVGIVLVHYHEWFVVGGGSNGMEFSVTLIACLSAIVWAYWPRKSKS